MKTILVQGAMMREIEQLTENLPEGKKTKYNGYFFYETSLNNTQIIISQTKMGIMNACIATQLAIEKYQPDLVINQGTAGAHVRDLTVGDIIIGETAVYINSIRTPARKKGEGSNAMDWHPGNSSSFIINADPQLLQLVGKFSSQISYDGKIICGRLGSGDLFSKETDRIDLLHSQLGELSEDMESVAVYKVCQTFDVPVIGIRVISNNEITGNEDVEKQFEIAETKLQKYILQLLHRLTDQPTN